MELLHSSGVEQRIIGEIEKMPEAVLFFNKDGRIEYANARGRELLLRNGNPATLRDIMGPEAQEVLSQGMERGHAALQFSSALEEHGTRGRIRMNLLKTADSTIVVSGNASRPRVEGYVFMYNAVFHRSADAMFIISTDTRELIDVSDSACHLTGYTYKELTGMDFDTLISPDELGKVGSELKRLADGHTIVTRKHIIRKDDQSVSVELSMRLVPFDGQQVLLTVARRAAATECMEASVRNRSSELSQANAELEKCYERLRSLDKMKLEFFTVISHELRTPLTTIKGYTELIKDGMLGPVNEEQRDRLNRIDASVDRLTSIVEGLSDLSGIAPEQRHEDKVPVALNELIEEVVKGVDFLAEAKRISIAVDIPLNLPVVYLNRYRIQQVLLNIINNAIKYTSDGGRISIMARDEGDHLLVTVSDTGIGIPQKDLENIFSGFYHAGYKLSYEYKGAGLGLAISKRIIESHGGRIWAESEPGKGSTIRFTLPKQAP